MTSRALAAVAAVALAGALAGAGCGDDSDETRSADSASTASTAGTTSTTGPTDPAPTAPSDPSAPGTSAPAGGSLPDRPADLVGVVTDSEGGRLLVEEQPDAPDAGRKAWVAIEGPVFARAAGGDPTPAEPSDVEVGVRVSAWTGICAESYPEQCAAEALVIE